MSKEACIVTKGVVTEALPDSRFRVTLNNGAEVLCTLAGKLKIKKISVLNGDKVRVEISPYDLTRGRISFRLK